MESDRNDAALGRLLAEDRWLRTLARRLAGAADAEDVAQDTWTALLAGRAPRGRVRAWMAAVLRNLTRDRRRRGARRRRREAVAARPEQIDGVADAAERAELTRGIGAAVRALEEPYRTTVLLHFFEGLRCSEIARREGVPASTVRNRLRRALPLLRTLIEKSYGGDPRALAVAPVLALRPAKKPAWIGATAAAILLCATYARGAEPTKPDIEEPEPPPRVHRLDPDSVPAVSIHP
ncbi:MAG: RNA polymerase sigma factor [Planctomycetota bacterium]|jgi:RNA polymerase sigma-70 factor (ECF subfamily)